MVASFESKFNGDSIFIVSYPYVHLSFVESLYSIGSRNVTEFLNRI